MRKTLQRFGPALGWASFILIATSIPFPGTLAPVAPSGADKVVHASMYAVLAWLSSRGVGYASARTAILVLVAVAGFGALDEFHQQFVRGRSAEIADWVTDLVGAGAGVLAFHAAQRRRESVS